MDQNKYKFDWKIIGNHKVVQHLQQSLLSNKIVHAYLFYGPGSIGKMTVAKKFIQSLECEAISVPLKKSNKLPCEVCINCNQFAQNIHPDVYEVDKEIGKKNITIEQIRALQHRLNVSSFYDSYKIGVINQAENLNEEAANSLLKILEEPHPKTVIILITSRISSLPPTIISRCQILKFLLVSKEEIMKALLNLGQSPSEARKLAHLCLGRPGIAFRLAEDKEVLQQYEDNLLEFLKLIKSSNIYVRLQKAGKILPLSPYFQENIEKAEKIFNIFSLILRDLILIKTQNKNNLVNIFLEDKLIPLASKFKLKELSHNLSRLEEMKRYLRLNINPRLALENFLLNL